MMPTLVVRFADADSRLKILETLEGDVSYVSEYGNFIVLENATKLLADTLRRHPLVESVEEDSPLEAFRIRD